MYLLLGRERESTICGTRLCSSNKRPKPNIALWDPPGAWLFSFQIKFHCLDGTGPLALTILFFSSPSQCMNVTGPHKEHNSTPCQCRKRLLSLIFNPEQPYCFFKVWAQNLFWQPFDQLVQLWDRGDVVFVSSLFWPTCSFPQLMSI